MRGEGRWGKGVGYDSVGYGSGEKSREGRGGDGREA